MVGTKFAGNYSENVSHAYLLANAIVPTYECAMLICPMYLLQFSRGPILNKKSRATLSVVNLIAHAHRDNQEHLGGVQPLYKNLPWTEIFARICSFSEFCFGGLFFISSATLQRRAAFESGEGQSLRTCSLWQAGARWLRLKIFACRFPLTRGRAPFTYETK